MSKRNGVPFRVSFSKLRDMIKEMVKTAILSIIIYTLAFGFYSPQSFARTEVDETGTVEDPQPQPTPVGTQEAQKYFKKSSGQSSRGSGTDDHYLTLHLGSFFSSDSYAWGRVPHLSNMGRLNGGLTYRWGSYGSFADTAIRLDFIGYDVPNEGAPIQIVLLPMIMFPDVETKFPLYFGVGVGAGFFFNQINPESFLSFNYQLVGGARFFDVVESTGFFIEGGLKNHVLLLSDGQFIGYFLAVGAVFTF